MTKLIIIAMFMAGGIDGGAKIQINEVSFQTKAACEQAKAFAKRSGHMWEGIVTGGIYRIDAACIKDSK